MPELARFYGIIVRMYAEVGVPHHTPHFHAYYQEHEAVLGIDPIDVLAGSLPRRQCRLVEAWAEIHLADYVQHGRICRMAKHQRRSNRWIEGAE